MSCRLHKLIAQSGYIARRKAEQLILTGQVKINGAVMQDPTYHYQANDEVLINNIIWQYAASKKLIYLVFNKPKFCLTTCHDLSGRKIIMDFIKINTRLFPIGRLDWGTEGLIFITNDGYFANMIAHPRYQWHKTYQVDLSHPLTATDVIHLKQGCVIDDKYLVSAVDIVINQSLPNRILMTISEGRNRQVRKMLATVNHKIINLKRLAIGEFVLADLPTGKYRPFNAQEMQIVQDLLDKHCHADIQKYY